MNTSEKSSPIFDCTYCHKVCKTKYCSRCKSTRYCSQECQKNDWNRHKPHCKENMSDSKDNKALKQFLSKLILKEDHQTYLCAVAAIAEKAYSVPTLEISPSDVNTILDKDPSVLNTYIRFHTEINRPSPDKYIVPLKIGSSFSCINMERMFDRISDPYIPICAYPVPNISPNGSKQYAKTYGTLLHEISKAYGLEQQKILKRIIEDDGGVIEKHSNSFRTKTYTFPFPYSSHM